MLNRWHEPDDKNKVDELESSMKQSGWIGSPLVKWGNQLYTGAHRSQAAENAEIEIPTIELVDVFEEAGLDFEEAHWIYGEPTADDPQMSFVIAQLPWNIKEKYGIDIE